MREESHVSSFTRGGRGGWSDKQFKRNNDDNNGYVQKWPQILPLLEMCIHVSGGEAFLHPLNLSCPVSHSGHWGTLANMPQADS